MSLVILHAEFANEADFLFPASFICQRVTLPARVLQPHKSSLFVVHMCGLGISDLPQMDNFIVCIRSLCF